MRQLGKFVAAAAFGFGMAAVASEAAVINGSDFTNGASVQVIGGITWSAAPGGSTFQQKTLGTPAYTGVGINPGRTGDEIDIGETLTGTNASGFNVQSLTLGVLFDGPEFDDVDEIAEVKLILLGGGTAEYTLTSTGTMTAVWTGPGTVTNLSPADSVGGAVWLITNPFGNATITSISFTALPGIKPGTNESDFTLVQMAVPEPMSLALLGTGLLGLGLARRRRR